jgi:hypothetical protein
VEILELAKDDPGVKESEAQAFEKADVLLLTNKDVDGLTVKQLKKYEDYFPLRTGTYVEFDGKKAKITEAGKTVEKEVPTESGWYEQDEFGMPFGKPSSRSNPKARHLYRLNKWKGLVVRWYGRWNDDFRRYVVCFYWPFDRFGVLGKRKE